MGRNETDTKSQERKGYIMEENTTLLRQALKIYNEQGEAQARAWMDTLTKEQQDQLQSDAYALIEKMAEGLRPIAEAIRDSLQVTFDNFAQWYADNNIEAMLKERGLWNYDSKIKTA